MSVTSDPVHASDLEPPGLMVPRSIFPSLRRTLQREVGSDTSARVLHHLGLDAGAEFEAHLSSRLENPPEEFSPDEYFRELSAVFATMGWGTLTSTRVHPGLSFIETSGWAEADTDSPAGEPSCHFSGGVFASLLARAADAPIAVLEVTCRTRGDDACGFLFGSEEAIQGLYTLLVEGASLEEALERL
ncbi:MAG: V4R domain-containing protein [Gemmatimonadota bacterium]